ncbi:MAG: hypothetical protein K2J82_05890, partial [Muribaculaceae bacterium]|nr:hypothetical protein [Muribaculaceae bacterium]
MIRIFKFKKNDLNPSGGKQIEYSISDVKDFFKFSSDEVSITFKYHSILPNDPLNGLQFRSTLKLSPARGDYKCYGNTDGSLNLKSFFLEKLHLTSEDNIGDCYALKKISENFYLILYIPQGASFSDISKFFFADNTDISDNNEQRRNNKVTEPLQVIYYGAPGTGKSYEINRQSAGYPTFRTTFHPDSDYASFVGAYKPISKKGNWVTRAVDRSGEILTEKVLKDNEGKVVSDSKIVYEYTFQTFLKAYQKAWEEQTKENPSKVFLVIEELNRGNCAQIFGDLFQLLDRNENGFSQYAIDADSDMGAELGAVLKNLDIHNPDFINSQYPGTEDMVSDVKEGRKLLLPNNLHIWATMNTSDQSLFPIDSAFKRRWDWKYVKIS